MRNQACYGSGPDQNGSVGGQNRVRDELARGGDLVRGDELAGSERGGVAVTPAAEAECETSQDLLSNRN